MGECPLCRTMIDDDVEICPNCWYLYGVNNFIDWNGGI